MRTLFLSILSLALISAACTQRSTEPLVAPGATTTPTDVVRVQSGVDADGIATSCSLEGTDENEMAIPKEKRLKPPTREEIVIRNCLRVRDAAEAWAAESGGEYPGDPETRNASGHTLIDFLPGGTYLENPFDGHRNQPLYLAWGHPGETEYLNFDDNRCGHCGPPCDPNGYMITGFGESGEIFRITQGWPDSLVALDSLTIANCIAVRNAAEQFAAENNGEYPADLSAVTPLGHTLGDFFPCDIRYLRNPYTGQNTEPVDGAAAYMGETGYTVCYHEDHCVGYVITGYGRHPLITIEQHRGPASPDGSGKIRPGTR